MNTKVLKEAARRFLEKYPGGFRHPDMVAIGKKHKLDQLEALAKDSFAKRSFDDPNFIVSETAKLVGRSSMISMFEKPKFRDVARSLKKTEKEFLSEALYKLLHERERAGFEQLVSFLRTQKLAKWPLATVVQSYYRPQKEVFIKPTTVKLIVERLDLDLVYASTPTWDFYRRYRESITEMKTKVSRSLSPNNPAFCGFLMMSLGEDERR